MIRKSTSVNSIVILFATLLVGILFLSVSKSRAESAIFEDPASVWHHNFCYGTEICQVGDFNGDGKDDIIALVRGTEGDVWVGLSDGNKFIGASGEKWHEQFCIDNETCLVGDFDGNKRDDVAAFVKNTKAGGLEGDVYVALSDGSKFVMQQGASKWHDNFCLGSEVCVTGDFNGDGRDDIAAFTRGAAGDVWVALSDGSKFFPQPTATKWHDGFCTGDETCLVGDFNGDGLDDVAAFVKSTKTGGLEGDVYIALSDGSKFVMQKGASRWHESFCFGDEVCAVGDVNGDGSDDIVAFSRSTKTDPGAGDVWVGLSDGTQFTPQPTAALWHLYFCFGDEVCAVGDVNGDKRDDILAFTRSTKGNDGDGDVWLALSRPIQLYIPLIIR